MTGKIWWTHTFTNPLIPTSMMITSSSLGANILATIAKIVSQNIVFPAGVTTETVPSKTRTSSCRRVTRYQLAKNLVLPATLLTVKRKKYSWMNLSMNSLYQLKKHT
jgi:hypothetical protein